MKPWGNFSFVISLVGADCEVASGGCKFFFLRSVQDKEKDNRKAK
jgi:hypothetical protein